MVTALLRWHFSSCKPWEYCHCFSFAGPWAHVHFVIGPLSLPSNAVTSTNSPGSRWVGLCVFTVMSSAAAVFWKLWLELRPKEQDCSHSPQRARFLMLWFLWWMKDWRKTGLKQGRYRTWFGARLNWCNGFNLNHCKGQRQGTKKKHRTDPIGFWISLCSTLWHPLSVKGAV